MTHPTTRTRATRAASAVAVLLALALVASGWDGGAAASRRPAAQPLRVLVLVDAPTAHDGRRPDAAATTARDGRLPAAAATTARDSRLAVAAAGAALEAAERTGRVTGELRVTRSPTEQLSVTRYFAARRFDVIVAAGLDAPVAVAPVRRAYPGLRFVLPGARDLPAAVARLTS
ncbi:MAG: hypothetical protein QOE28_253 [Solirubrobacteraceae bacterium]|nr:hypothetical protein [Solirubrobacteraceae bacterium]